MNDFRFARAHAGERGVELRQHAALAQRDRKVFGLAPGKRDAVDLAAEIDHDAIFVLCGTFNELVTHILFAQDVERMLDIDGGNVRQPAA